MKLTRSLLSLALVTGLGACITDPGPIGTNGGSTGTFSVTIAEFQAGPTNGGATFRLDQEEGVTFLTLSLVDTLGISILLNGPGAPVVGTEREIGTEDGLLGGVLIRPTASGGETYVLTAGKLTVDAVSGNRLVGQIEFTARQEQGSNVGAIVHGSGNFSASGGNSQR